MQEAFASDNALLREKLDGARHRQLMLEQKMDALEAGHREQIRAIHARTQGVQLGFVLKRCAVGTNF